MARPRVTARRTAPQAVKLTPELLDELTVELEQLAKGLGIPIRGDGTPRSALPAPDELAVGEFETGLLQVSSQGLSLLPPIAAALGTTAEALQELVLQYHGAHGLYTALWTILTKVGDAQLVVAAVHRLIRRRVQRAVERIRQDPTVPADVRAAIEDDYAELQERMARERQEAAEKAKATIKKNEKVAGKLSEMKAEEELQDVLMAMSRGAAVPRDKMARAAATYQRMEEKLEEDDRQNGPRSG